ELDVVIDERQRRRGLLEAVVVKPLQELAAVVRLQRHGLEGANILGSEHADAASVDGPGRAASSPGGGVAPVAAIAAVARPLDAELGLSPHADRLEDAGRSERDVRLGEHRYDPREDLGRTGVADPDVRS